MTPTESIKHVITVGKILISLFSTKAIPSKSVLTGFFHQILTVRKEFVSYKGKKHRPTNWDLEIEVSVPSVGPSNNPYTSRGEQNEQNG